MKNSLKPSQHELPYKNFNEAVFVDCRSGNETLRLGIIYRTDSENNTDDLNKLISAIVNEKPNNLLIMGDFNYKQINWNNQTCCARNDHPASKFLQTCKDTFLIQNQNENTRFGYNDKDKPSLLDLVLSNHDDMINEIQTVAGLGKSDHATLIINLKWSLSSKNSERLNHRKADFSKICESLQVINWDSEFHNLDTNDMWLKLRNIIDDVVIRFTPKIKSAGVKIKKFMNQETLEKVRLKHRTFRRKNQTRDPKDIKAFNKARNQAQRACRKARKDLERKVAEQSKDNPKAFYSYVSQKNKSKSGIADLKKADGSKTSSDNEKAELLNSFFQSVFTIEDSNELPTPPNYNYESELNDFDIPIDKVKKLLSDLNVNKAAGPDGIHPLLLSKACNELAYPFTLLFQSSLREGKIPEEWRQAKICPIFKKGSKMSANNYRPVSLTCIACKLMEKLVREKLVDHLEKNLLITDKQHGFVSGKSCVTQLLDVLDTWTDILDDSGSVDIIYMDYQKAFDSVPHRRLIMKTEAHGIGGPVLRWINDFLSNRKQSVVVGNAQSSEAPVTSGIPQGSVLGPVLFILYINDLPQIVDSEVRLFADDTKIFTRSDRPGAVDVLQSDLQKLETWSKAWLLKFHPLKCQVLKLGKTKSAHNYTMSSTSETGESTTIVLNQCHHEKDLGVIIDENLSFKEHVMQATSKANKIVGIIRRSFDYLDNKTFVLLFKSLVRPIIEYGNVVWHPQFKYLQQEIEDVQRRATKLLSHLKDLSYSERLKKLGLPSLEHRRRRGDMLDVYKYL